jgi:hypothetical protein
MRKETSTKASIVNASSRMVGMIHAECDVLGMPNQSVVEFVPGTACEGGDEEGAQQAEKHT